MKVIAHKEITREKLLRVLPPAFAELVPKTFPEPVTVVYFPHPIVTGRIARKALENLNVALGTALVMAAKNFTEEARAIGLARSAQFLRTTTDFIWRSDASITSGR